MQWLWANKEWLFSGLGIALIGVIYRFWFHQPHGRVSIGNSSMVGSPVASGANISQTVHIGDVIRNDTDTIKVDTYDEQPTPDQIKTYLESLPIYQRADAAKAYCRFKVSWPVKLFALDQLVESERRNSDTTCTHEMTVGYGNSTITALVDIEKYPRLKISHQGTLLRISGVIERVGQSGTLIRFKEVQISFDSEAGR
jgi:hypothetical protein